MNLTMKKNLGNQMPPAWLTFKNFAFVKLDENLLRKAKEKN